MRVRNASTSSGSKCVSARAGDLLEHAVERPRVLVGARGGQRVEDVADRADAPDERDLARRSGRSGSRCRPSARDGCGRSSRPSGAGPSSSPTAASAPVVVWVFMISHSSASSLPGFSRIAVGDADLADVVHRACDAQPFGVLRRHARLQRQQLADAADALDVQAGLLVAELGRLGEAVDRIELGLLELGGALLSSAAACPARRCARGRSPRAWLRSAPRAVAPRSRLR